MAYRKEKLEELIKRVVSELIIKKIKDPRIGFATITKVSLNKDFSIAKIGISVFGDSKEMRKTLEGFQSASGYIQHHVSRSIKIRNIPRVQFFLDSSVSDGAHMAELFDSLGNTTNNTSK